MTSLCLRNEIAIYDDWLISHHWSMMILKTSETPCVRRDCNESFEFEAWNSRVRHKLQHFYFILKGLRRAKQQMFRLSSSSLSCCASQLRKSSFAFLAFWPQEFLPNLSVAPQWFRTLLKSNKNILLSFWARERAVQCKRTSERCEQTSEQTSNSLVPTFRFQDALNHCEFVGPTDGPNNS